MAKSNSRGGTATAAPAAPQPKPKPLPEKKIGPYANGVGVCIWVNRVQLEDGSKLMRSVTINPRRYFDRESQQWKDAGSYNPADLPALLFALTKAQGFCYETPLPGQDGQQGADAAAANGPPAEEIPF